MATTKKAVKKAAPKKAVRASKPTTGFNAQAMDVLWLVLLFTVLSVVFAAMSYWRYHT